MVYVAGAAARVLTLTLTPTLMWQVRLREYFHRTKHLHVAERRRKLLCTLSPTLQGQIVLHINSRWLNRVWFFQGAEHEFMTQGDAPPRRCLATRMPYAVLRPQV